MTTAVIKSVCATNDTKWPNAVMTFFLCRLFLDFLFRALAPGFAFWLEIGCITVLSHTLTPIIK